MLGFWLVSCFLIPRTAFVIARAIVPDPHRIETSDGEGANFLVQRASIEKRLLAEYHVTTAAQLPVSTWGMTLYEREIESTARYNRQFAALFDSYARQQRIVDWISFFSPPLAMRTLSMALTGTDVSHYRDFAEAAERYRYTLVQRMNQIAVESRLYNSSPTLQGSPDQPAFPEGERAAYESVPSFTYRVPNAKWALGQTSLAIAALGLWGALVAGFAALSLRRLECS